MRDRLVIALVSLTLAVVAVFLVERLYSTSNLIRAEEERKVERSAETIAAFLGAEEGEVRESVLESVLYDGEHLVYVAPDGTRYEAERHSGPDDEEHDLTLSTTRPVAGGGTLTLSRDTDVVDDRVADALLPLVMVALGLILAAALTALWLSRRLARPFGELADAAGQIGRGDFEVDVPRSRVPEADAVARALKASARDLDVLVRRERDFAAHASHELRTPITAARLEIEEAALDPGATPEVLSRLSGALGQLDRLSDAVAEMLDASRASREGTRVDIDLAALLRDTVARWRNLAPSRDLDADCTSVVRVRMPAGSVMQIMDVLIGNAVTHGTGRISVDVVEAPAYVEVRVTDEGTREAAARGMKHPIARGAGGLAKATEIAEGLGGQLRLSDAEQTTFSLVLPRPRSEAVAS
ncbi:MAG: HAMP domain-containing sensor histidine kinase [Actinomycetota bacterium]